MGLDGKDYFVLPLDSDKYNELYSFLAPEQRYTREDLTAEHPEHIHDPYNGLVFVPSLPTNVDVYIAGICRAITDYIIEQDGPIQELQDILALIAKLDNGPSEA
jgi:hypothetical protein